MIEWSMVKKGYENGLINLIESPNDDGVVCEIGDGWFYFGGIEAEGCTVEEYKRNVPSEDIIDEIFNVLEDFCDDDVFIDEYIYYECFLREHGIKP